MENKFFKKKLLKRIKKLIEIQKNCLRIKFKSVIFSIFKFLGYLLKKKLYYNYRRARRENKPSQEVIESVFLLFSSLLPPLTFNARNFLISCSI